MNRAMVIRASRGLADHLLATVPEDRGPVAVGRDARLSSAVFMEDVVAVLVAAGLQVVFFPEPAPTPLVAYAARHLGAVSAVVVTASHNPPADNGYKVYAENSAQIVPPADREIAAAITAVGPAIDVPRTEIVGNRAVEVPADLFDDYLREVASTMPPVTGDRSLSIVYTAMHGVGGRFVLEALERFGFSNVHPVAVQLEPDGRFPTVAFPNPEEQGAMDRAHELAVSIDAELVIANDPDTDRLAVSLVEPDGGYCQLTGNQIGVLLGEFLLQHDELDQPIVLNSIVSSPMLASMAEHHRATYDQTLTGFKWIWNAALDIEAEGPDRFVFGYEEALGYSVGQAVRDKDGISAAVVFADLVAACEATGITVWERLAGLYRKHGLWASLQKSIVRPGEAGAAEIASAMDLLGRERPTALGGKPVTTVTDYRTGSEDRPRYLAAASLVELGLGSAGRVLVRPSGTEPKLKIYVDLRADLAPDEDVWAAEADLLGTAAEAAEEVAAFLQLG
jgi:phosphomannomutase